MSYQPHLHKGGELYHYRTKGSKNGVSNTPGYRAIGKKAVGFLNAAGQYVYNNAAKAAGAAKEFVTGNKAKAQYNKADWRARNTGSTTIGKGYKNSRETQERIGMARYTNARRADAASKAYGKTLPGIAKNTKAAIKTTGKNVGNWLNNRAGDAKKAGNAIGEAASSAYKNAREFITGENAKKELDRTTKGFSGLVTGKSGKKKAKEQYGKTLPGMIDNAKKGINDIINDPKKAADNARKAAGDWLSDRGENISNTAKKAGQSISKFASDSFDSAKKTAGDLANKAGKNASKAAKTVSKFASDSFDSAKKTASEGANRAGDFISGLFGKEKPKKASKPTRSSNNESIIKENVIKETIIPEKLIKEETIPETKTKNKKAKVDAKEFARFVVESNKNANKSSVSTNDKPDGVSDEYWRDYKFNGGTRESWDKQNKSSSKSSSNNSSKASEYRFNAALARDAGEMHVDNDKKYREKYNKKTTAQDIINRNKERAHFVNKSKSYEKAADSIDGMGNKYEYKRVKTSSKAIPYSGYYAPKSENVSKSSSKSSNSAKSDYERELEFNSRKNNEFGMGSASENPNFSYYTVDKETGKTVWVDKNGKKHYN